MYAPSTGLIGVSANTISGSSADPKPLWKNGGLDQRIKDLWDLSLQHRCRGEVTGPDGVPDYRDATMQVSRARLDELGRRLDAFDSRTWPRAQRVDHLLVLAADPDLARGVRIV